MVETSEYQSVRDESNITRRIKPSFCEKHADLVGCVVFQERTERNLVHSKKVDIDNRISQGMLSLQLLPEIGPSLSSTANSDAKAEVNLPTPTIEHIFQVLHASSIRMDIQLSVFP